jgi:hypothetical protein
MKREWSGSAEFFAVLEALRVQAANPNAPLEFFPIRIRLRRVVKHLSNLPIPAAPPVSTDHLPIPVGSLAGKSGNYVEIGQYETTILSDDDGLGGAGAHRVPEQQ